MLKWLFRKRPEPAPAVPAAGPVDTRPAEDARALWRTRLQSAQGDDAALLRLAQTAPLLEIKLAAVEALADESALKQAEREFRSHDRKVHQRARQRLATAVARRETRAAGARLIAAAEALAGEPLLAANLLVALDRDWKALDAGLLEPDQRETFAALRERLDATLREHGEAQQRVQRWRARATQVLAEGPSGASAGDIEPRIAALQALREARPDAGVTAALDQALQAALDDARRAVEASQRKPEPPPQPQAPRALAPVAVPPVRPDLLPRIEALLDQAEAALAEGQSAALQQHLQAADLLLDSMNGLVAPGAALRARHHALHAERARLKGWQQWGGALARDALVDEAEALARLAAAPAADPDVPRLNLKNHGQAIRTLRARWKEIDRSGAAASQSLWQRFDAALTLAHGPVAAQQAALKASRQENLLAREALLATLEAVPAQAPSVRDLVQALDVFHQAWRKLGPLEHTVPAAARGALQDRLRQTVEQVERPVLEARREAEREREQFVVRAEALASAVAQNPSARDVVPQVRDLQAEWQQHARTLPLARAVESALWARFRQATDAVFTQREAAAQARDAEFAAGVAVREALLQRAAALASDDASADDAAHALAGIDREWRQAAAMPRGAADAFEARFRDARAAAARALAGRQEAQWQAQCDSLLARLRLCEEREAGAVEGQAESTALRDDLAPLPAPWERALAARGLQTASSGRTVDELLLQLEAALEVPAAPEWVAARHDMKLRALKDSLEGRASRAPPEADRSAERFAQLLGQPGLSAMQRERLLAIVAALRRGPPPPGLEVPGRR